MRSIAAIADLATKKSNLLVLPKAPPKLGALVEFVIAAWEVLEPETDRMWNWHHDLICEYLELVDQGKIKKIVFNIPPRHL
ncbi:MAG: hypothetical protein ACRC8K_09950, partial [Waterburya sp.]